MCFIDRNLRELAATVQVDSIYAVPTEIDDKKAAAHILAAIVHVDPEDKRTTEPAIAERLDNGHSFAWVARRVRPDVAARIRALNMKGIYFQKEFQRFYPDNQLAAQVLGYVGLDDNGLGGLEQKFDSRSSTASPAASSRQWTPVARCSVPRSMSPSPARTSN